MSAELPPREELPTHEVSNQPEARGDIDLWASDPVLRQIAEDGEADREALAGYGAQLGRADMRDDGRVVNRQVPELTLFDRAGRRLDEVRFHPDYHRFMALGIGAGYAARAWEAGSGGHLTHAAMVYLASQVEPGHCCPMTMTYAAVPALSSTPEIADLWQPKLTSRDYDTSLLPVSRKSGATIGMAMTEKQGGSDVRANSTRAERTADGWRLTGHKWFCSAPMSDGFLTLAQTEEGLSCFLVPRWLEGQRNPIHIQRLKDKLGNRSNASAEIEYNGTFAQLLGEEGRGVQTIIEMVHHTRLDTAMAPAGLMRAALSEAHYWCNHRSAFQKRLIDQPLMRRVLADLALDWHAALALGLRVARAFDSDTPEDRAFARIAVALAKFSNNKRCGPVVAEAMEVLGGMGYVEDTPLPMLYREAPLNGIWEGSGNVICLDILRTLGREPKARESLRAELEAARGLDRRYDAALTAHEERWKDMPEEADARWFAEALANLLAGSVLLRQGEAAVSDAFIATRIAGERGQVAGAIGAVDGDGILSAFG
jgi:putative acyl-CoA dehydrogenase